LSARHHTEHARGQITRPTLDAHGVATEPAQRSDAPIAVNQNQTLATLQNFDWRIGHRNTGDNLAAALDRTGDPLDRARLSHAGAGDDGALQTGPIRLADSDRVGWVNSREHTRVNSRERQG
jgi:hypothetical protein